MLLLVLALAWMAGIAGSAWGVPAAPWSCAAAPALIAILPERRRPPLALALGSICAGLSLLAGARWDHANRPPPPSSVVHLVDAGRVQLHGVVRSDGEERERSQRFRVDVREAAASGPRREASGGVLVRTALGRSYRAGDVVVLEGHITAPPDLPGFDYRAYLARQGIQAQMDYPRVQVTGTADRSSWLHPEWLLDARRAASRALDRSLPHPESDLARGIITGERSTIPRDLAERFNQSGTSHLIAISGYNITLVSGFVMGALAWLLGRRRAAWLALAVITLYALFVGLTPSVARALVMGVLVIAGTGLMGRPGAPLVSLASAAAIMTAHDPRIINDLAFQLSFTATAGIMVLVPVLQDFGQRLASRVSAPESVIRFLLAVWEVLAVTLAASVATLPVMLHAFGRISPIAPLANLVLAPLFPVVMVTSAITATVSALIPSQSVPAGAIAWAPLAFTVEVARTAADLPGASADLGRMSGAAALLMYGAGGTLLLIIRPSVRSRDVFDELPAPLRVSGPLIAAFAPAALVLALAGREVMSGGRADGRLTVEYTNAGGAPVALLTTPSGARVLVDAGPSSIALSRAVDPLLPDGNRRIHLLALTRRIPSTVGGVEGAVERYQIPAVGAPPTKEQGHLSTGAAAFTPLEPGSVIQLGRGARLEFEAYPRDRERLAVVAAFGQRRIALTPGVEGDVRLQRGPSARQDDLTITVTGLPLAYDPRAGGPVRVSTDGQALWLRPARGPRLPAGQRTTPPSAHERGTYDMLARALLMEAHPDPRRWPPTRPAPARPHHPGPALVRRRLGHDRVRPYARAVRGHG